MKRTLCLKEWIPGNTDWLCSGHVIFLDHQQWPGDEEIWLAPLGLLAISTAESGPVCRRRWKDPMQTQANNSRQLISFKRADSVPLLRYLKLSPLLLQILPIVSYLSQCSIYVQIMYTIQKLFHPQLLPSFFLRQNISWIITLPSHEHGSLSSLEQVIQMSRIISNFNPDFKKRIKHPPWPSI